MKKQLFFFLMAIFCINCYSQINFEKGHYINNNDQKINCFIKNVDWRNNPNQITIKLPLDSKTKNLTIKSVKEFEIYNVSKYIRSKVNIDMSSDNLNKLSNKKEPIFSEEELFLKVLVEGKANLYQYILGNRVRYFYNKDGSRIEQLIMKKYYSTNGFKSLTNNKYKRQLWKILKCSNFKISKLEKLVYKKKSLTRFFIEYNECNNSIVTSFEKKKKRDLLNFTIRPGLNSSSLSMNRPATLFNTGRDVDFGTELSFRIGIELEYILGFNNRKWALILEPTFQYFKSEKEIPEINQNARVDYKSIELPIGIRHFFFLNEGSSLFINGSYIINFTNNNSTIDFDQANDLTISGINNFGFGVGVKHKNKYILELRYLTKKDFLVKSSSWNSNFNTISVIFGYTLF